MPAPSAIDPLVMHEDLLGYLLGALEPHEMRRVERWLREDPEARRQLAEVERALKPLEDAYEPVEPPPADLVSRTLDSLPPLPAPENPSEMAQAGELSGDPADPSDFLNGQAGQPFAGEPPEGRTNPDASEHVTNSTASVMMMPMNRATDAPRGARATWLDWVGGATAVAVFLGLLLPTLAEGRFQSRKVACQDQLRKVGTSITQFVIRNPQERLPAVAEQGPEAFAGMYAVRLNEAGLMIDPAIRWCPSLETPAPQEVALTNLNQIATVAELYESSVDRLKQIQRVAGGHYAYSLGVIEQEQLTSPKFESRSSFAVLSDAPLTGVVDRVELARNIGHSGIGINVLYEDGRVRFVPLPSLDSMPDHPLLNHRGRIEAGVNIDDAALAPSWRPPFVNVRQR